MAQGKSGGDWELLQWLLPNTPSTSTPASLSSPPLAFMFQKIIGPQMVSKGQPCLEGSWGLPPRALGFWKAPSEPFVLRVRPSGACRKTWPGSLGRDWGRQLAAS